MAYVYGNPYAMPVPSPQYIQQYEQFPSMPSYQQSSDAFYEDFSRQLAVAAGPNTSTVRRRHSRSSHFGSRTPGSVMRVTKPTSANTSPQSSFFYQQQQQHVQNQHNQLRNPMPVSTMSSRPARPVSWHPGSMNNPASCSVMDTANLMPTAPAPHPYASMYSTPLQVQADDMAYPSVQPFSFSPAVASMSASGSYMSHSNQTSPSTAFSPYLGAFDAPAYGLPAGQMPVSAAASAGQYYSPNPWGPVSPAHGGALLFDKLPSPDCAPLITLPPSGHDEREALHRQQQEQCRQEIAHMHKRQAQARAEAAALQLVTGIDYSVSAPRTPPTLVPASAEPVVDDTANTAGAAGADDEVLVGMGLYDPPEKTAVDVTLQSYRSSMALLGAPTGAGLKLEAAWEPPVDMDEMDDEATPEDAPDDDDDERDAEGEGDE